MNWRRFFIPAIAGILILSCGGSPTDSTPGTDVLNPLAGGGRLRGHDPADGSGYTDSLPQYPGQEPFPWPEPWTPPYESDWYTIFVSEFDCANSPGEEVIDNFEDWKAWWDTATSCAWIQGSVSMKASMTAGDTLEPWIPGDTTIPGQFYNEPPFVDFEQYLIAAIRIPFDSGDFCMRGAYVTDIGTEDGVTTIYYEVSRLGGDCCDMIMRPFILWAGSPVVAVAFKRPESGNVKFVHSEVTHECWMPSPDDPVTLHYTDAPCDLGPGEELITGSDAWDSWFRRALYCDSARWSGGFGTQPEHPDSVVADTVRFPMPPYNWWIGTPEVDFETQAVIILRAGEQTRWGGGVWLTNVIEGDGSTTIEYCVMDPGGNCPTVDGNQGQLHPTVAIRIKKPESNNIIWHRTVEPIPCDWGVDSTVVFPF
ncbi:MAG: hypothetical protein AB1752_13255 [Candidatus Zixiibacteriota bacterium]